MPSLRVHPIDERDVETAFAVLRAAAAWLGQRGRRQRIAQTTLETYRVWQAAGANYGVSAGDRLVGVFTVVREPLHEWPDVAVAGAGAVTWLRALATHPDHRGVGVGETAIRSALEMVHAGEPLYLDCVSDFLPDYYAAHGFETVATQTRTYPDGAVFDLTLMRRVRGNATA